MTNRFCEHEWKYKDGYYPGLVYYGKVLVYGCHDRYVCKKCGKSRHKIQRYTEYKLYNRKEVEDYHKKIGYVRPPVQLEFL